MRGDEIARPEPARGARLEARPEAHADRLPHLPVQVRAEAVRHRVDAARIAERADALSALHEVAWFDVNRIKLRVHHLDKRRPAALRQPVTDEDALAPRIRE